MSLILSPSYAPGTKTHMCKQVSPLTMRPMIWSGILGHSNNQLPDFILSSIQHRFVNISMQWLLGLFSYLSATMMWFLLKWICEYALISTCTVCTWISGTTDTRDFWPVVCYLPLTLSQPYMHLHAWKRSLHPDKYLIMGGQIAMKGAGVARQASWSATFTCSPDPFYFLIHVFHSCYSPPNHFDSSFSPSLVYLPKEALQNPSTSFPCNS